MFSINSLCSDIGKNPGSCIQVVIRDLYTAQTIFPRWSKDLKSKVGVGVDTYPESTPRSTDRANIVVSPDIDGSKDSYLDCSKTAFG